MYSDAIAGRHTQPFVALEEPARHLRVLVARPALIPAAVGEQRLARPHAGEYAGVQVVLARLGVAVARPLTRAAAAQRRPQSQSHRAGDRAVARREQRRGETR